MVRYAVQTDNATTAKSRGAYLRVHFKNTSETANAIKGMSLQKALNYYADVKAKKRCIPFRRFDGSTGRTGQALEFGVTHGRWPVKSVEFVTTLLKNAEANAVAKGLEADKLFVKHIQVNQAPKTSRRSFRAHGRIAPFKCSPSHVEVVLGVNTEAVPKGVETEDAPVERATTATAMTLSRRKAAKLRTAH